MSQVLEELKRRCKWYLGQLYELIKPVNYQYDIAVKVALGKQLKFLVVENEQGAEYCTEFLKEKGLFKDVLVLQNVPERQLNSRLQKELKNEGNLVYDVIEVSRRHQTLEKALRYFLVDKVVCKDFDSAVKLQKKHNLRDIVCEDGTEFKQGMISGGQHQNVFNLELGQFKLNKEVTKLVEEIAQLDNKLQKLKEGENSEVAMSRALKEVSRAETELEIAKNKVIDKEREIKSFKDTQTDTLKTLKTLESQITDLTSQINQAEKVRDDLQRDINEAEAQAFKPFLKKYKLSSVKDYEKSQSNDYVRQFNEKKNNLTAKVQQCEAELKFIENNEVSGQKGIQTLEGILRQEEEKLQAMLGENYQSEAAEKLKLEMQDLDLELQTIKKQLHDLNAKQLLLRQESERHQTRIDHFQKEVTVIKIQIKSESGKKQTRLEEA